MESVDFQCIDGGQAEPPEPRPGVVVPWRSLGQPEAGEIDGDSPQAMRSEFAEDLAVAERRAQHAVKAQHRLTRALGSQEASDTVGRECLTGIAVGVNKVVGC